MTTETLMSGLDVEILPGQLRDYETLVRHHYRAGPPATIARRRDGAPCVIVAREHPQGVGPARLAGVLVVSMPTLNTSWRRIAWPGSYRMGDKRDDARALNATLRCISRVIIEPRFRGLGIARRLVRSYLDDPLTPRTEAVAAMGRVCPFFASAGMTEYPLPPSLRDARLLDALAAVGIEPWELLEHECAARALARHAWLAREARVWARGAPGSRRFVDAEETSLLMLAASHAAERPVAYAYGG